MRIYQHLSYGAFYERKFLKKKLAIHHASDKTREIIKKRKSVDALLALSLQVTFHTQIHPHHNHS
jgi:hypothetical protein